MTRPDLLTRALDALEALMDACPQDGPNAREIAVDREALAGALHDAMLVLYESGRDVP